MPPVVASTVAEPESRRGIVTESLPRRRGSGRGLVGTFIPQLQSWYNTLDAQDRRKAERERREAAMVGIPDALDFNPQQRTVWDIISPAEQITMAQRSAFPVLSRTGTTSAASVPGDLTLYEYYRQQEVDAGREPLGIRDWDIERRAASRPSVEELRARDLVGTQSTFDRAQNTVASEWMNAGIESIKDIRLVDRTLELIDMLDADEQGTGPWEAKLFELSLLVPGVNITQSHEDKAALRFMLDRAVLSQLRATFGAQFTEGEGQLLRDISPGFGQHLSINREILRRSREALNERVETGRVFARQASRRLKDDSYEDNYNETVDELLKAVYSGEPTAAPQTQPIPVIPGLEG